MMAFVTRFQQAWFGLTHFMAFISLETPLKTHNQQRDQLSSPFLLHGHTDLHSHNPPPLKPRKTQPLQPNPAISIFVSNQTHNPRPMDYRSPPRPPQPHRPPPRPPISTSITDHPTENQKNLEIRESGLERERD